MSRDGQTRAVHFAGASRFLGLAAAVLGCGATTAPPPQTTTPPPPPSISIETVATGLDRPVYLTAPAGDPRLFIVEQTGRILIIDAEGGLLGTPFLDLSGSVSGGNEQGLLGLAFHPSYDSNGLFFVSYTDLTGVSAIERYAVSGDPNVADAGSAKRILTVAQPFSNHNGGQLLFGLDGMLFVFLGDGGGAGDPLTHGQDPSTLLGSILRIDVDGGDPYAIPADNPFVGGSGRGEIWAIGVRNPWRSWFDAPTGTLLVADVGQNDVEEVNAVSAVAAGVNYGWNTMEGSRCFGSVPCDQTGLTLPVVEYTHGQGCSITGGAVYRGSAIPEAIGHYFYSDFCSGFLRSVVLSGGAGGDLRESREWDIPNLGSVTSFGVDASGEVYVMNIEGRLARFVPASD